MAIVPWARLLLVVDANEKAIWPKHSGCRLATCELGLNIVVADNMKKVPISRRCQQSKNGKQHSVKDVVQIRFRPLFRQPNSTTLASRLMAIALAPPGIPVVAAPKSVLVITANIWDDASRQKTERRRRKQFTIFESLLWRNCHRFRPNPVARNSRWTDFVLQCRQGGWSNGFLKTPNGSRRLAKVPKNGNRRLIRGQPNGRQRLLRLRPCPPPAPHRRPPPRQSLRQPSRSRRLLPRPPPTDA